MINLTLPQRIAEGSYSLDELAREIKGEIRVSLPCIVTAFDPVKQTINCIPSIRELINIGGKLEYTELPELREVPIEIPRAGNYAITLPITVGQECRVTFQDLCIDSWWVRGGIQNWNDLRRHDLSDAIATFSPWSQPNSIPEYSTTDLEIRSLDNSKKISLKDDQIEIKSSETTSITVKTDNQIEIKTGETTNIAVKTDEIHLQVGANSIKISNVGIEVIGVLTINGTPYLSHLHSGVMSGQSLTGPVSG